MEKIDWLTDELVRRREASYKLRRSGTVMWFKEGTRCGADGSIQAPWFLSSAGGGREWDCACEANSAEASAAQSRQASQAPITAAQ